MYLNLFLGFTYCDGYCKFCEKGNNLIYFGNEDFFDINNGLEFLFLKTKEEFLNFVNNTFNKRIIINISGYEPLSFLELYKYISILKYNNPNAIFVLKTSGLIIIEREIFNIFDKIELSIYGSNDIIHNSIIGNNNGWNILNINIENSIKYGFINKFFFQTIIINSNKNDLLNIIKFSFNINNNAFKIIYPRFIPKNNISELIGKKETIIFIFDNIPSYYYNNIIINNIIINNKLSKYFYEVSI